MKFSWLFFNVQLQNPNDAIRQCNEALKVDENDVDALCDKAEANILNEQYDEGEFLWFHYQLKCAKLLLLHYIVG